MDALSNSAGENVLYAVGRRKSMHSTPLDAENQCTLRRRARKINALHAVWRGKSMHSTPSGAENQCTLKRAHLGWPQSVLQSRSALISVLEPQHKINALEGVERCENLVLESMAFIFFEAKNEIKVMLCNTRFSQRSTPSNTLILCWGANIEINALSGWKTR